MRRLTAYLVLLLALSGLCIPGRAEDKTEVIVDPIKYVTETYAYNPGAKLLRLQTNLARDGQSVLFLSFSDEGDRSGNFWRVFAPVQGGYRRLPVVEADGRRNEKGGVRFRVDAFFVGFIKELKGYGLATYHPGGGGEGALGAIVFEGDALRKLDLGVLRIQREEADEKRYEELFGWPGQHPKSAALIEQLPTP